MDNKKTHINFDNLAVPEVHFGEDVFESDVERDDMHVFSENLAVPEVRAGKIAKEKNREMQEEKANKTLAEKVEPTNVDNTVKPEAKAMPSGKNMHLSLDNLAIPEIHFEEEPVEEAPKPTTGKKKMHVDYSGAVPQIYYTEE